MRYRPLGPNATVISAISVALGPCQTRGRPSDWTSLVFTALENGVNAFEVTASDPAIMDGLAQALQAVERRLVSISWRIGSLMTSDGLVRDFSGGGLTRQVCAILARTGIDYLDAVLLDDPESHELQREGLEALAALKSEGAARMLGVAGDDDALDAYITTGAFDLIATPFNLTSGWKERHRLRAAVERDMAVIGYRPYPESFHRQMAAVAQQQAAKAGKGAPLTGMGSYAFLDRTQGWDAEEICLAYALTEPALASVQIEPQTLQRLEQLASVADREMPPGLAAQIEMARFSRDTLASQQRQA